MATRVVTGLHGLAHPPTRAVVTVGVFDGVHLAHQQLIRTTVHLARRLRGTSVLITFDPDPHAVLDPRHAPSALMPLDVRVRELQQCGLDWIWVLPFTKRFARMTAKQFVKQILLHRLRAVALVVGETFVFGKNRQGNMDLLRAVGPAHGMQVAAVRPIRRGGLPISSSRIRRLIGSGKLSEARRLLGRSPALYGDVVSGAGRGHHLGFPTVNVRLIDQALPPQGVYAVIVQTSAGRRAWRGVMNFGVRPTFGSGPLVCEVHLLGFRGTLKGHIVTVSLLARLRSERCFPSPQALIRQVHRDLDRAQHVFARLTPSPTR